MPDDEREGGVVIFVVLLERLLRRFGDGGC
jgi:hypothetical protein